ncbi:MAG: Gfo/Idh/MocA family oxidoreductase, partial [Chloroflexi bacterium]|nr:Gfo/Idh/MocA family oxidoreductase [Chloroflexota bacterium]
VHALTWVLGVAGPARAVTAVYTRSIGKRLINGKIVQPDIVDNALITLELANGALATIITNYCTLAALSPSYELYGSKGTILVNTPQGGYLRYPAGGVGNSSVSAGEQPGWFVPTHMAGLQAQPLPNMVGSASSDVRLTSLGHFVECIRTGATPVPSAGFARHTLDVMLKAAEAAASGQRQTLTVTA